MSKPSTRLSLLTRRGERRSSRLNEPNSSKICVQRQSAKRWRQKSHRAIRTPWLTAWRRSRWRRKTIPKPPTWSKGPWSQINTRSRFCILIDKTETQGKQDSMSNKSRHSSPKWHSSSPRHRPRPSSCLRSAMPHSVTLAISSGPTYQLGLNSTKSICWK